MTALRVWTRQLPLECQLCTATRQMVEFEVRFEGGHILRPYSSSISVFARC